MGNKPQHILFWPKQPLGLMLIKRLPFEDKWSLNLSRLQHLLGQDSFRLTGNLTHFIIFYLRLCPSGSPWTLSSTATNQPCWQSLVGRRSTLRTLGKVTPQSCSWKARWMARSNRVTPNSWSRPRRSMAPPRCLPGMCSPCYTADTNPSLNYLLIEKNKIFWGTNCLEFAKIR